MEKVKTPIILKVCIWSYPVALLNIAEERTSTDALGSVWHRPRRKFSKLDHKMNITSRILYTGELIKSVITPAT
jgi:hypothetical protein